MSRFTKITRTLALFALLGGAFAAPSFASAQVATQDMAPCPLTQPSTTELVPPPVVTTPAPGPGVAAQGSVLSEVRGMTLPTGSRFEEQPSYGLFQLTAGHSYRIETFDLSGDTDTVLELRRAVNPNGPVASDPRVAENDDGPGVGLASVIEWTADQSGPYYAHIRSYSPMSGGTFSLRVREIAAAGARPAPVQPVVVVPAPSPGPPTTISPPTSGMTIMEQANLSLAGGGFASQPNLDLSQLAPGHTYRIETFGLGPNADTVLEIRGGSAASASEGDPVLAENDDAPGAGLASRIEWAPNGSGPSYLHIRPYAPSTTGSFGLRIVQVR